MMETDLADLIDVSKYGKFRENNYFIALKLL